MRPYRKLRVASIIRDIVSEAIAQHLNDPRVDPLTSVMRVEMSPDIMIANIYLHVPGGEVTERKTLIAIRHASKYIQRLVAKELTTRNCPELRFNMDGTSTIAQETLSLIEENRKEYSLREDEEGDSEESDPAAATDNEDPTSTTNRSTNIENESNTTQP